MLIALRLDCDYRDKSMVIRKVDIPCPGDWLYMPIKGGWITIQICDDQFMTPAIVVDYWRKDRGFVVTYDGEDKGELLGTDEIERQLREGFDGDEEYTQGSVSLA
jgi:hypothetical protein